MSTTATTRKPKSATDIISSASRHTKPPQREPSYSSDPRKKLWCDTVWANLSLQAKQRHSLPTEPYFDPETMLLSREVNAKLWGQLVCEMGGGGREGGLEGREGER